MSNIQRMSKGVNKGAITSVFLLLFFFSGMANASLSGIEPGFPRFISKNIKIGYHKTGDDTFHFDAHNSNKRVFWQQSETSTKERLKSSPKNKPKFDVYVDIDASDPSNPQVSDGSHIEIHGKINSLSTENTLLFGADIKDLFWTTGKNAIIEFIMDGQSMQGKVCELGFCSSHDEVLQFKLKRFNGNWNKHFHKRGTAIATVPVPAAVWLFGSAIMGLISFQRRKSV